MTTRASVNSRLLVVEIRATSVIPEWSDEVLTGSVAAYLQAMIMQAERAQAKGAQPYLLDEDVSVWTRRNYRADVRKRKSD